MPDVWLLSDPHLGHAHVAATRGFDTVEEHDRVILANLRRALRPHSICWWLGDVALGGWRNRLPQIAALPGTHRLVLGNHDRAHPLNPNGHSHQRDYLDVFASVSTVATIRYEGIEWLLSHFPYDGDTPGRAEDRHLAWRPRDLGQPILHGHTHSLDRFSLSMAGTPQVHIGVDAWGLKPVSLHEATQLLYTEGKWTL